MQTAARVRGRVDDGGRQRQPVPRQPPLPVAGTAAAARPSTSRSSSGARPLPLSLLASLLCASCAAGGGGAPGSGPDLGGGPPAYLLLADTNRDGVIDGADVAGKADWGPTGGALFLANLDDDDSKGAADASDQVVNGADDALDLARIAVSAWPALPAGATARLTVEGSLAAAAVHLFRTSDGKSFAWLPLPATLSAADLAAPFQLAIEATSFVEKLAPTAWDGYAVVRLLVTDRGGATLLDDRVKLRVAPFVMVNNLSLLAQLWNASFADPGGQAFHGDLTRLADGAAMSLEDADPPDPMGDPWDEDWWQVGITFMPAAGGPHGMRVAQRSAQPDRLAGGWAEQQLGPDVAFIWPHTPAAHGQADPKAYSLDSFGDHDTLPPYTKGSASYPLGRIIVGGNSLAHIDATTRAFYDAQKVQPVFQVDTTWLLVGHIDEIVSYVPAATPRGWKLLLASPRLARTLLSSLVAAGQGSAQMFKGKDWIDANNQVTPATITVSALLGDPEIMAANEAVQLKIDEVRAALQAEVGLTDDEVVEVPFLFERVMVSETTAIDGYEFVAHMPGTVNLRAAEGWVGIPAPHGPVIAGTDFFQKDLQDRLGSDKNALGADGKGLHVTFVEDWDDYHIFDGEVHCGTTVAATAMPAARWWEAGR